MTTRPTWLRLPELLLALLALVGVAGCGQGEYERRMQLTEGRLRQAAKFSILRVAPQELPGTPVLLRIPQIFYDPRSQFYTPYSADPSGSGTISIDVVNPPFVKLPGLKFTFQATATAPDNAQFPYFCYLAAISDADLASALGAPAAPEGAAGAEAKAPAPADGAAPNDAGKSSDQLLGSLLAQVAQGFPGQTIASEDVAVETPSGGSRVWKRISASGEQPFQFIGAPSNDVLNKVAGKFDLYVTQSGGYQVMIGWRVPTAVEDVTGVERLERMTAGTLRDP